MREFVIMSIVLLYIIVLEVKSRIYNITSKVITTMRIVIVLTKSRTTNHYIVYWCSVE